MTNNWNPVTYDDQIRQLSAVPDTFANRNKSVLSIVWQCDAGNAIEPGTKLGIVQWEDNSRDAITAPANCTGVIDSVNRNITFENLPFEPAQWLIILRG